MSPKKLATITLLVAVILSAATILLAVSVRPQAEHERPLPNTCRHRDPAHVLDKNENQVKQGWDWKCWRNGLWRHSVYYKRGEKHGMQRSWYRSGRMHMTWNFHYGDFCGVTCSYDDKNGAKCAPVKNKPCPRGD